MFLGVSSPFPLLTPRYPLPYIQSASRRSPTAWPKHRGRKWPLLPVRRRRVPPPTQTRELTGLRQSDVAGRLRKPQPFVSRYEAGQRRLDLVELEEICRILGIKLSEFVKMFEEK